jgi:hypothetical protein
VAFSSEVGPDPRDENASKKICSLIADQDLASRVLRRGAGLASSPRSEAGNRRFRSRSFMNSSYFALREQATDRRRNGVADAGCDLLVDGSAAGEAANR